MTIFIGTLLLRLAGVMCAFATVNAIQEENFLIAIGTGLAALFFLIATINEKD